MVEVSNLYRKAFDKETSETKTNLRLRQIAIIKKLKGHFWEGSLDNFHYYLHFGYCLIHKSKSINNLIVSYLPLFQFRQRFDRFYQFQDPGAWIRHFEALLL